MSTQHTRGPWFVKTGNSTENRVCDATGFIVATVNQYAASFDDKADDANARLIAAAPDLLAVLQELEESSSYWSDYDVPVGIVDRIKAAITKATGKEPS